MPGIGQYPGVARYNFQLGCLLLKVEPPADRRGAQMKAPSERASRGKYAGGVLECNDKGAEER